MPLCPSVDCGFSSSNKGLYSHCSAKGHPFRRPCHDCKLCFQDISELDDHLENSSAHFDYSENNDYESDGEEEPYCDGCDRWFVSLDALDQHLAASSLHNWCFGCSRDFKTENALSSHRCRSPSHDNTTFKCPLCKSVFNTPSSLAHHIESGCQVIAAVHSLNVTPKMAVNRPMHEFVPASTSITTMIASQLSFNGTAYACFLCTRTFRTLALLNTHLSSSVHDADEFRCPGCGKKVKVISALVQHIESGVCGNAKVKEMTDQSKGNSLTSGEHLQDSKVTSKVTEVTPTADVRAGEAYSAADYASPARAYSVDDKSSGQSECCFGAAAVLTCDYTPPEEKIAHRGIWRYLFCM